MPRQQPRAQAWALASGIALPIAAVLCAAVVERTLVGVNPLATIAASDVIGVLIHRVGHSQDWDELAIQFVSMAASGLALAAVIARPHTKRRSLLIDAS